MPEETEERSESAGLTVCVCAFHPHLLQGRRRRRPALVQHILGQIPLQLHEEGVADVIQKVFVLRAALPVAVNEAFDEPEGGNLEEAFRKKCAEKACYTDSLSVHYLRIVLAASRLR